MVVRFDVDHSVHETPMPMGRSGGSILRRSPATQVHGAAANASRRRAGGRDRRPAQGACQTPITQVGRALANL